MFLENQHWLHVSLPAWFSMKALLNVSCTPAHVSADLSQDSSTLFVCLVGSYSIIIIFIYMLYEYSCDSFPLISPYYTIFISRYVEKNSISHPHHHALINIFISTSILYLVFFHYFIVNTVIVIDNCYKFNFIFISDYAVFFCYCVC